MRSTDLSVIFYTCNRIAPQFADAARAELVKTINWRFPIVSVTHKPIDFGRNICVGEIGASSYNCYQQILTGAKAATTHYCACAEDDCLYTPSHFAMRPPDQETFLYNLNRWWVEPTTFRYRKRTGMHTCIVHRELLIETLEARFAHCPRPPDEPTARRWGWGEPGRYEKNLGLPRVKMVYAESAEPVLTFNHRDSLGGRRKWNDTDELRETLPPWGRASDLWARIVDGVVT